ncbi:MAG: GIY-YIG nuclease family protein [Pseudomonadota bacterium]
MAKGDLAAAEVLITDCQTTGSTPQRGHLLEAAWVVARAGDPAEEADVHSALAQLPDAEVIPNRISRLTGITLEMMLEARPPKEIWRDFVKAAKNRPILAHFAQFEERFYRHLNDTPGPARLFPLEIICTHRIACHLLPDLPRRGMRVLAGYFGHPLPELKRAAEHVRATLFIWGRLVELLGEEGVVTFDGLHRFLDQPRPARGKRFVTPLPRDERLALPDSPGIYRFINAAGKVIYVGKATSLRSRVNSYYRKRRKADKELEIVSQAARVETETTGTSLEAALLEAAEIKRIDPPYNTALRDAGRAFGSAEAVASLAAEKGYPLGRPCPVTDITMAAGWFTLVQWLERGELTESGAEDIWKTIWLDHHAPCDRGMFEEGVALFLESHGLERGAALARALRTLGCGLWLELQELKRLEREARASGGMEDETEEELPEGGGQPGETEEDESEADEVVEVTPELISGRLTLFTMTTWQQFRKGRWLALLAGARVSWDQRDGYGRRSVTLPAEPPDTLEQYDLLRVLTTELRRLIRDGRNPEVRLRRGRGLDGARLIRILELV